MRIPEAVKTLTITDKIMLTSANISDCLAQSGRLHFHLNTTEIWLTYRLVNTSNSSTTKPFEPADNFVCTVSMTTRPFFMLSVLSLEQSCVQGNTVVVKKSRRVVAQRWTGCELRVEPGLDYVSRRSDVTVTITVGNRSHPFTTRMHIRPVLFQSYKRNRVRIISESKGYIQSFAFDMRHKTSNSEAVNSYTKIDVPSGHVAMVSIADVYMRFVIGKQTLAGIGTKVPPFQVLSLIDGRTRRKIWRVTDAFPPHPGPVVLSTTQFKVHFKHGRHPIYQVYQFRVLFSFHPISAAPQQLSDGLWNCSSSIYADFKFHLTCNLIPECDGGRDERGCSHTPCAHNGVVVANRCFFLSPGKYRNTWLLTSKECAAFGARLASIDTPEVYEKVPRLMRFLWLPAQSQIFVGLKTGSALLPSMYRSMNFWQDSTLAIYPPIRVYTRVFCGKIPQNTGHVITADCERRQSASRVYGLCELPMEQDANPVRKNVPALQYHSDIFSDFLLNRTTSTTTSQPYVICPQKHATHAFLTRDQQSSCFSTIDVTSVEGSSEGLLSKLLAKSSSSVQLSSSTAVTSLPPSFLCASIAVHVPYTFVCDHHRDCLDNSDEVFCVFPVCDVRSYFRCESKQCIPIEDACDGFIDCMDKTDEIRCSVTTKQVSIPDYEPCIITLDGRGGIITERLQNWAAACPETHFKCLSDGFCVPVYVRCNGINDCPEKDDEQYCDSWKCAGLYRCRGFMNTCLHPDHLCDGWPQCPQHDDERYCNLTCPAQCSCFGQSWICRQLFQADMYPDVRFLDADSSNGMKPSDLAKSVFLIRLSLSNCGLTSFRNVSLPNLLTLNLGGNRIRVIERSDLEGLPNLNALHFTGNPVTSLFAARTEQTLTFPKMTVLDLSNVKFTAFSHNLLAPFPNVETLNLSGCGIEHVASGAFKNYSSLRVLDMRGCLLSSFSAGMLKPLTELSEIHADNFKVCCPLNLPDSLVPSECDSPEDRIASCDDLFKSNTYRASWHLTTVAMLFCNAVMMIKRIAHCICSPRYSSMSVPEKSAADMFITSLFVCGFIHAVYMTIVGTADLLYSGSFLLKDTGWRHGLLCAAAGFLWLLSTEVALFLDVLITLDRILVSWFPYTSWRFSRKSTVTAISLVGVGSIVIALLPLMPKPSRWKLFQRTVICSPLFLDSQMFPGHHYLFVVFSVFHFIVSWLVAFGQLSVYLCLHRNRLAFFQSPHQTIEHSTSRRVMAVVLCDVIFWLVLGHSSYLTVAGVTLSNDVVVQAQVLVMPLNWTFKPVLHAVAILLENRRRDREDRMLKILIAKRRN